MREASIDETDTGIGPAWNKGIETFALAVEPGNVLIKTVIMAKFFIFIFMIRSSFP